MNTWTPLWSSTVESTLWEEPGDVRLLFFTLLMIRDPDHVVRMPLRVIAKKANLDPEKGEAYRRCEAAMKVLLAPDTKSEEPQEFEGRRVRVTPDGFYEVLNAQKYIEQMSHLWKRLRKTQAQRARRERERQEGGKSVGALPGETLAVEALKRGDEASFDKIAAERRPGVGGGIKSGSNSAPRSRNSSSNSAPVSYSPVPTPEEIEDNNGEPPTEPYEP